MVATFSRFSKHVTYPAIISYQNVHIHIGLFNLRIKPTRELENKLYSRHFNLLTNQNAENIADLNGPICNADKTAGNLKLRHFGCIPID